MSEQTAIPMPDPARALDPALAYDDWQIRGCMRIEDEYRVIVRGRDGREHRVVLYLTDDHWTPLGSTPALDRSWWPEFPTTTKGGSDA